MFRLEPSGVSTSSSLMMVCLVAVRGGLIQLYKVYLLEVRGRVSVFVELGVSLMTVEGRPTVS